MSWHRRGDGLRPFRRWAVVWRNGMGTAYVVTSHFTRTAALRGYGAAMLRKGPWTGRPDRPLVVEPTGWGPRAAVRGLIVETMQRQDYMALTEVCRRTALPLDVVLDVLLDLGRMGWAVAVVRPGGSLERAPHEALWRIRSSRELCEALRPVDPAESLPQELWGPDGGRRGAPS